MRQPSPPPAARRRRRPKRPKPPETEGGETGAGQPATPKQGRAAAAAPAAGRARRRAAPQPRHDQGDRIKASPLARRLAEQRGVDLSASRGSGPERPHRQGRCRRRRRQGRARRGPPRRPAPRRPPRRSRAAAHAPAPAYAVPEIPHEVAKLSNMRKTIARRLTESKQNVPHIYLTVDIHLDALLKLRGELNAELESRGVKLSVNDMLIKALAVGADRGAGVQRPVRRRRAGQLQPRRHLGRGVDPDRADHPGRRPRPTPRALSAIATEMKDLAGRAREGKLKPEEYQGGTASLSNMGMYGIKQFEAVINPPQGMIMAIGAGEKRPYVIDDSLQIATVMSATGSFDHRAIDGADGARLMQAFKALVEAPLGMLA